jgi:hypothetical protein
MRDKDFVQWLPLVVPAFAVLLILLAYVIQSAVL